MGLIIASGARISDAPYILGNYPLERNLLPFVNDPSPWGLARENFCADLENDLFHLVERSFDFTRPSLEMYNLLVMLTCMHKGT